MLCPDDNLLDEITVTALKNPISSKGNIMTANVEHSVLSKMGSFDDLMNKIPFVTSNDCNVSVFGRGDAVIYLNNRKVYDTNLLSQLKSQQITKVEVITNPESKYGSDVSAVVKIYTKDNPEGWGASANLSFQLLPKFSENIYCSAIYVKKNWEVSASFWTANSYSKEEGMSKTALYKSSSEIYENYDDEYHCKTFSGWFGLNYSVNENSNIGLKLWSYSFNYTNDYTMNLQHSVNQIVDFNEQTNSPINTKPKQNYAELYYTFAFKNTTGEFTDVFMDGRTNNYNSYSEDSATVDTKSVSDYTINSSTIDFKTRFNDVFSLTYGAELTYTDNLQTFSYSENNILTSLYTNNTTFKQILNGDYINAHLDVNKFVFDFGLRYEFASFRYYHSNSHKDDDLSRNYSDFMPNVNIGYSPTKKINFSFGYRVTLQRPSYNKLSDNFTFQNRYNYSQGNSGLETFYKKSFNAMFNLYDFSIISSFNSYNNKIFGEYSDYEDYILLKRQSNAPDFNEFSIGAEWSKQLKSYTPTFELDYSQQYLDGQYLGNDCDYKTPGWSFSLSNSFSLPKQFMFSLSFGYSTPTNSLYYYNYETWKSNIVLTKSFDCGLSVTFSANHLFVPNKQVSDLYYNYLCYNETEYRQRVINVSLNYNFKPKRQKHSDAKMSKEFNRI